MKGIGTEARDDESQGHTAAREARGLARCHGFGDADLPNYENLSATRTFCTHISIKAGLCQCALEHCRGRCTRQSKGVSAFPWNRPRITCRSRDSAANCGA